MGIVDPAGYSEAVAHIFTWLADKVLGGARGVKDWGWKRAQWVAAQDRYDAQIIKQYGEIRIFGQTTPKSLKEVFTDVFVLDRPTAMRRFDPEIVREHLWAKDREEPWRASERVAAEEVMGREDKSEFFILGRPGAGKTTFLKRLAVREAQRGKWGPCLGKIPIFVSLKEYGEAKKPLLDYIVDQFAVCHFPDAGPFVEPLLKSGKALVLFDGLDEVTKAAEARDDPRGRVMRMIEQFARQYDGCHVVVTCRIAATEYTFPPPFAYLEMADFAPEQVNDFVRGWFWDPNAPDASAALTEKMLAEWQRPEQAGIRDLGRNPLLLTLLCLSYAETLRFPERRSEIYEEALRALLQKWDVSRRIERGSGYKGLSVGRKQQMFSRIAYDAFLQDEILFGQEEVAGRLVAYLAHVPGMPEAIDIDGEIVLREIIEQHGLFAEQSRGLYSFAHLSFQEYYAAKYIAESTAPDALAVLMARITDDKWREVFLLVAEMLPDATQFLATFEGALQRLVGRRPRLTGWLNRIDEEAGRSKVSYRQAATRQFYALNRDLDRNPIFANALSLARFRASVPILDLDLDCDRVLASGPGRYLGLALALDLNRDHAAALDRDILFNLCQEQGRTALYAAIAALAVPDAAAPDEAWEGYAAALAQVVEVQGKLARYRRLETEAAALEKALGEQWALGEEDLNVLTGYLNASSLFYDCLQVAKVADRRGFEDRMFWVPGATDES